MSLRVVDPAHSNTHWQLEDLTRRIQAQEDIEAIKQLRARYCLNVDEANWSAMGDLFAEDAVWDGGPFGRHAGRAAIQKFFDELPRALAFAVHYVMNPIIELQGEDRATGIWYLLEPCTMREGNQAVWGTGRYDEEYTKLTLPSAVVKRQLGHPWTGEWKFQRVKLTPGIWTPYAEGWVNKRSILDDK
ncbi:MAG: nuclear transport factor 2 family protein [Candidatus Binatia bacterium]